MNIQRVTNVRMAVQPLVDLGGIFSFLIPYTLGRTPYMGDQPVATETEQTHTDIHASSGVTTHDPSVRVGEDSS
jgi:hypothetical protein